jgi:hypothetical protein
VSKEDDDQRRRFREQQKREADQRRQAILDAAAAEEQTRAEYNKREDAKIDDEFRGLFGDTSLDQLSENLDWMNDDAVKDRIREISRLHNKGDNKRAKKIAKRDAPAIKAANKAAKAKKKSAKGCGVVSILIMSGLVAALGSAGWLAIDTIGALIK